MRLPIAILLSLLASGCLMLVSGRARMVRTTPTGGTVALRGPRESAQARADELMTSHCGGRFRIHEQREVAYGTHGIARRHHVHPGQPYRAPASTEVVIEDKTEWHIDFTCSGREAGPGDQDW